MADLEAGRYDVALVLGAEIERNVGGELAAQHLGAAAHIGHEGAEATFMWPHLFAELADEYDRRYGLDDRHMHAIAELNLRNARKNPNAQTRDWTFTPESFTDDDTANPRVEGRVRRTDCGQVSDGARRPRPRLGPLPAGGVAAGRGRSAGWGHRTAGLSLAQKFERSADDPYVLPHVRRTILDAFARGRRHRRRRSRRDRDARLLLDHRVRRARPLRHHRAGRELAGDRERRPRDSADGSRSTRAAA